MPATVRFDAGLEALVRGDWRTVAEGLGFTEGPLWHPDGYLLFSDQHGRICRMDDGEVETYQALPGQAPNGLTWDLEGRLLVCFQDARYVGREENGEVRPLVTHYEGKRFNSPNDIIVRSDGRIYFTDPPYGLKSDDERELPYNGVFTLSPAGELRLLLDDFDRPNGLAFSPDEQTLYIADTARHHVRTFAVAEDGALTDEGIFAETREEGRPDGLKVDRDGRVFVCAGSLQVFDAAGKALGVIDCAQSPANCAWGEDGGTLFVCARTSVYALAFDTVGIAPYLR